MEFITDCGKISPMNPVCGSRSLLRRAFARTGAIVFCYCCLVFPLSLAAAEFDIADRVLVSKSERKLYLFKADKILRDFDVVLGLSPIGHKQKEGDFKTPEGVYTLDTRNPHSDFFLSIKISYPNPNDTRRARMRGEAPGGQIMIHGQPNEPRYEPNYYAKNDWTNGCIAVSDSAMVDIWLMTVDNTPIEIVP